MGKPQYLNSAHRKRFDRIVKRSSPADRAYTRLEETVLVEKYIKVRMDAHTAISRLFRSARDSKGSERFTRIGKEDSKFSKALTSRLHQQTGSVPERKQVSSSWKIVKSSG